MPNGNILIVDYEPHIIEMLKIELEHAGYAVFGAVNMEEAVNIVNRERIDLGFFDLNLPGVNGMEIYHALKKIKPGLKGVVFTGSPDIYLKLQEEIFSSDIIDDILRKPMRMGEAAAAAKKLLKDTH